MNELVIREIEKKDLDQVIQLIKIVYQENYDKKYYDKSYLEKYINNTKKKITFWKGAFFQEKLIAQMFLTIKNGLGKLKFTMVDPEFASKGVLTYLGFKMEKILQLPIVKNSNFHIVYAYVGNKNVPVIKALENFQFKLFGRTPSHNKNTFYKIYGRVIDLGRWKYITPHFNISRFIQKINIKYKLKRLLSVFVSSSTDSVNKSTTIERKHTIKNKKKKISFLVEEKEYAIMNENDNSWYDFKFINDPSRDIKFSILVDLIRKFKNNQKIFSISMLIDVNDLHIQDFLLKKKYKFFAYLPFYHENDIILMGTKKEAIL
ncbi:MAG: hypothetical protein ACFFC3_14275 [Candidatus Odinarchaeota archaeon]